MKLDTFVVCVASIAVILIGTGTVMQARKDSQTPVAEKEQIQKPELKPEVVKTQIDANIYRIVDYEAWVVCWVYENMNTGGISCLPISETNYRNKKIE